MSRVRLKLYLKKNKENIGKILTIISVIIIIMICIMLFTFSKYSSTNKFNVASTVVGRFNTPLTTKLLNSQGGVTTITGKGTPTFSKAAVSQTNYDSLADTCTGADCASKANSIVENGMYAASDDYGTSYYYRGSIDDNNLLFAGYCWKVVRINGDGSTRIIYNGTQTDGSCSSTSANIGSYTYNNNYQGNAYVGYMYGNNSATNYNDTHANTTSSTAKTAVDTWYQANLVKYADYISDTEFCNDRSINSVSKEWASDDTALGYGANATYYAAYKRIEVGTSPTLICQNKNDRFTVSDTTVGNGALTYPIALPTADELSMSGAVYAVKNTSFNLYSTKFYWTMTPSKATISNVIHSIIYRTNSNGDIYANNVDLTSRVLRPVINLKKDTKVSGGSGLSNDPYIITNEVIDNTVSDNMISAWAFNSSTDFHSSDYKQKIKNVNFVNNTDLTDAITLNNGTGTNYWDISANGNKKVLAWLKTNATDSTMYDLYIGTTSSSIIANTDSSNIFNGFNNIESVNFNGLFDTSKAVTLSGMFYNAKSLKSIDLSTFKTTNVTNMSSLFEGCTNLTSINLTNLDTSNVITMYSMFDGCSTLDTIDVSSFATTKVTNFSFMFHNCNKLTALNVTNFNTSSAVSMLSMFYGCKLVTNLDLSNFNTSNVTDMRFMFGACNLLSNLNILSFNTSKVTSMEAMFNGCNSLTTLSLTNFDTSNVTSFNYTFAVMESLTSIDLSSFDLSKSTDFSEMLNGTSKVTTAYAKDAASCTILNDSTKTDKPTTYNFTVKS